MFCPYCGKKIAETSLFCEYCGKAVKKDDILKICDDLYISMKQKGLESYLTNDFLFDSSYVHNIQGNKYINDDLYKFLHEIMDYLHLSLLNVELNVIYSNDDKFHSTQTKAGQYQTKQAGKRVITVNVKPDYGFDEIAAILCHECTHYFMDYHELSSLDVSENENRTDVLAVLLGFFDIMQRGYYPRVTKENLDNNQQRTITSKIGYITDQECEKAHNYLLNIRKDIENKKSKDEADNAFRDTVSKNLATAYTLNDQIKQLLENKEYVSSSVKGKIPNEIIQNVFHDIAGENIQFQLDGYKKTIDEKANSDVLNHINESIKSLSTKMTAWISTLQGNYRDYNNNSSYTNYSNLRPEQTTGITEKYITQPNNNQSTNGLHGNALPWIIVLAISIVMIVLLISEQRNYTSLKNEYNSLAASSAQKDSEIQTLNNQIQSYRAEAERNDFKVSAFNLMSNYLSDGSAGYSSRYFYANAKVLVLDKGGNGSINVTFAYNVNTTVYYKADSNYITCTWGNWSGTISPLYISAGSTSGMTEITFTNTYDNELFKVLVVVR